MNPSKEGGNAVEPRPCRDISQAIRIDYTSDGGKILQKAHNRIVDSNTNIHSWHRLDISRRYSLSCRHMRTIYEFHVLSANHRV